MTTPPSSDQSGKVVWGLLLVSSLFYFFSANDADNDLWGHLLFGRDILAGALIPRVDGYAYTTAGHPWVNHEWLSQVVLAAVYQRAGSAGLLLVKFLVAAATFLLVFRLIRRDASTAYIAGAVGLLTIAVLARGFAIRPQIFTYLGVALTLVILDQHQRGHPRALWLLPAFFVLWANLHGGFTLGLAIFGLFAGAAVLRGARASVRTWVALIASVVLTVLNPYGPRLLLYVWNELGRAHPITEWQPASPRDVTHFVFFAMFGLFVGTLPFLHRWRARGWEVVLALGIGVLALRHQRHTAVFALCAAAPLAGQLENAAAWLRQRSSFALSSAPRVLIGVALVALATMQIAFTGLRWQRDGLQIVSDPADYPVAAVRAMRRAEVHANVAVPLDWGEYVLWHLTPQVKVSLDGRFATLFPEQVVEDNFNFFSGAPGWRRLLEQYPTDAALVPVGSPCPIGTLPNWQLVFETPVARLYARTGTVAWPGLQQLSQESPQPSNSGTFP